MQHSKDLFLVKKAGEAERISFFELHEEYSIIQKLKLISPKAFEDFLQFLFEILGFPMIEKSIWTHVGKKWKALPDGGIDLIADSGEHRVYIQSKRLLNKMVGVDIVRAFYGTIVDSLKPGDLGMIITTSIFSTASLEYGKGKSLQLIDYRRLLKLIKQLDQKRQAIILHHLSMIQNSTDGKYIQYARTCKECYAPMKKVSGKFGKKDFYGCLNYQKEGCRYIET